ncbi:MAG: peroxiredoxin [Candidatus Atabeyarchaeum deiterrae]|jgi:peroxiredoxin (alkyl hydroperoxide reductase subunit C)
MFKAMMESMEGETHKFLLIGEKAPSFEAQTTRGKVNFPDDYKGKWIVLFSHPADFTPVCTTEFVAFQKRFEQFEELNAQLIGLSIDQVFAHIKWVQWIKENLGVEIQFPVIADDRGKIAEMFGMIHPAKATNTVRAVFIIDPEGIVRLIIYYPQEVGRNFDEIIRVLKALQVVDKNKVATPANWPNNELIGDEVIIPPPKDVEAAEKRKDEYECYDWWFCHKKLLDRN